MTANLTASQRTLAIMSARGGKATAVEIADDDRWHGRWPGADQVLPTLTQMAETGLVIQETDPDDGQLALFRIDPRAEERGVQYAFLLAGVAPMFGGELGL